MLMSSNGISSYQIACKSVNWCKSLENRTHKHGHRCNVISVPKKKGNKYKIFLIRGIFISDGGQIGSSDNTSDLYSGDSVLESRYRQRLSRLRFFVVFLSRSRKIPGYLKTGRDNFKLFHLIIHYQ
jgi:hypothetical protein